MLKNEDIVSVKENLMAGKYKQLLSGLRQIGLPIKQAWLKSPSSDTEKYKFTSNATFKKFLVKEIENKIPTPANIKDIPQHITQLINQLSRLALFLTVWKDDAEFKSDIPEVNQKKLRQQIKFKASLDKDDRYAINIALQTMVFILCQQSNNFIQDLEKTSPIRPLDFALKNSVNAFEASDRKEKLIDFIYTHIHRLNEFSADRQFNVRNYALTPEQNQQEIEKIGLAISSFLTPNKKKKFIKYAGILLAFIAASACGLTTGGAIFLLFPSLAMAISFGTLISLWGFAANFGFLSENLPDFLLSLFKKGGMSEYIDEKGKRQQLSAIKQYLFIPLVVLASLTVGSGTTALSYTTVLAFIAKLLPILSLIWPPLPFIIVGILAAAVGIGLTIAVLTATIGAIKNSQAYSWNIKAKISNLTKLQILAYVFKGLLVLLGLFGLAYFRYVAGLDLSMFIGPIAAVIMGAIAFIPQAFFTVSSINKLIGVFSSFTNKLIQVFSSSHTQQKETAPHWISRAISITYSISMQICLIGNALGNAALVVVDSFSAWSLSGAIGCFFNSWSGNLFEPDMNKPSRNLATKALIKEVDNFNTSPKEEAASSTSSNRGVQLNNLLANEGDLTNYRYNGKYSSSGYFFFKKQHRSETMCPINFCIKSMQY